MKSPCGTQSQRKKKFPFWKLNSNNLVLKTKNFTAFFVYKITFSNLKFLNKSEISNTDSEVKFPKVFKISIYFVHKIIFSFLKFGEIVIFLNKSEISITDIGSEVKFPKVVFKISIYFVHKIIFLFLKFGEIVIFLNKSEISITDIVK